MSARIAEWNEAAAGDRRRLLEAQLAGGPLFELRASVSNRPGVIAELALELGRAGVNITDMALYPAADMTEGVVALWIAGEAAAERTERLVGGPRISGGAGVNRDSTHLGRCAEACASRPTSRSRTGPRSSARWSPNPCVSAAISMRPTPTRRSRRCVVLGAIVEARDDEVLIRRTAGLRDAQAPDGVIDVGNAGTLMRLLPGWLSFQAGRSFTLDGDESIRRRPVDRIAEPLVLMGARIEAREERFPPFTVHGGAAARNRLRAAGRQRPGQVVRAAGRARDRARRP